MLSTLVASQMPTITWTAPDAAQQFKKFKRTCQLYFEGPLADLNEERKIKYLLLWAGEEGQEVSDSWGLSDADKKKIDVYWTKFEKYVNPKNNFRLARYQLRNLKQEKKSKSTLL